MQFSSPLVKGLLLKRYKRFLADIQLDSGAIVTAHCPNTGKMLTCSTPGSAVYLSQSDKAQRKYAYTLEMIRVEDTWVGVNTARTNKLVAEAILLGRIDELRSVERIAAEVKTSSHTRLDLHLIEGTRNIYVEVKTCSLVINGCAMFPDAVTKRGTKHLQELIRLAEEGSEACIFFLVQRMDADRFTPAVHIDAEYGKNLHEAIAAGVRVLIYQAHVSPQGIDVVRRIPFISE
jgi:sugar fermentation stimulation protein A